MHAQELIQAVRNNDLARTIHLVWTLHASPFWAPGILPLPAPECEDKKGKATTARRAAVNGFPSLPPPRRSRDNHVTALHLAAQMANYEATRVRAYMVDPSMVASCMCVCCDVGLEL